MQYLLLICAEERIDDEMSPADMEKLMEGYVRFGEEAAQAGIMVDGARLRPTTTATTVRVRDGRPLLTDGPFAETKEQIGGYYLIDVANLDEALRWAARIPSARLGAIEVRPVWPSAEYLPEGTAG